MSKQCARAPVPKLFQHGYAILSFKKLNVSVQAKITLKLYFLFARVFSLFDAAIPLLFVAIYSVLCYFILFEIITSILPFTKNMETVSFTSETHFFHKRLPLTELPYNQRPPLYVTHFPQHPGLLRPRNIVAVRNYID